MYVSLAYNSQDNPENNLEYYGCLLCFVPMLLPFIPHAPSQLWRGSCFYFENESVKPEVSL